MLVFVPQSVCTKFCSGIQILSATKFTIPIFARSLTPPPPPRYSICGAQQGWGAAWDVCANVAGEARGQLHSKGLVAPYTDHRLPVARVCGWWRMLHKACSAVAVPGPALGLWARQTGRSACLGEWRPLSAAVQTHTGRPSTHECGVQGDGKGGQGCIGTGGGNPPPPRGRPAYAQPLSP